MSVANWVWISSWGVRHVARGEYRLRVNYGKTGRLRWLSHLEVARALERSVRRAGLEYGLSQGFNPHMKIAFGPALPVGTSGEDEYYDVWLTRYTAPREILDRLTCATASELAPVRVGFVSDTLPSLAASTTIGVYSLRLEGRDSQAENVKGALERVIDSGMFTIEHKGKEKVFDLARVLPEEIRVEECDGGSRVELTVRMGPEGALRPDVFVRAAMSAAGLDVPIVCSTRSETYMELEEGLRSRPL